MHAEHKEKAVARAKFLTRSYLYNTAADYRRIAARLMRDADQASEEQARLMRDEAVRMLQASKRFAAQADEAPVENDAELPFS